MKNTIQRKMFFSALAFLFLATGLHAGQERVNKQLFAQEFLNKDCFAYPGTTVIDAVVWQEMGLDAVLARYDHHTTSIFGAWSLRKLSNPIARKADLEGRQKMIKSLVDDRNLFDKADQFLRVLKDAETGLLRYCKDPVVESYDTGTLAAFQEKYASFEKKYLNGRFAWEASELIDIGKPFYSLLCFLGLYGVALDMVSWPFTNEAPNLKTSILQKPNQLKDRHNFFTHNVYDGNGEVKDEFASRQKFARAMAENATALDQITQWQEMYKDSGKTRAVIAQIITMLWLDSKDIGLTWDAFERIKVNYAVKLALQNSLVGVAKFFRKLDDFIDLIQNNPQFASCNRMQNLIELLHDPKTKNTLNKLKLALSKETFDQPYRLWYWRGIVAQADALLSNNAELMRALLQAAAELDAYMTLAKIYKQHSEGSVKFSFVEFVESPHAQLIVDDCWVPLIPVHSVVANSIALGKDGQGMGALFTGPNGGGKSTIMKAIAYTILLGQSWGMAPAAYAQLTLFDGLRTSLYQKENIEQGLSTFMAEKARAQELAEFVVATGHADKKCFVMLDEPCKGTVEKIGSELVCELGNLFATQPHSIAIIATHLEQPINLAKQPNGYWKNYHPTIKEADGKFVRMYKLAEGPALWWFTDQAKCMRFARELGS